MHLTIVSPFPPFITGIGQYGYHITRALAHSGMFTRVSVLAGSSIKGKTPNHLGLTEIEYCWKPGQLNARQAILSRVKGLCPDLVWFNMGASVFGKSPWSNLSGLSTPMFVRRLGIPTVITLHELIELADLRALNAPGGWLAPLGARMLTEIGTQADMVCVTMQRYKEWLAARNINCMHIPIGAYHEPDLLQETDSQELLFFTTLAPFKGLELLLHSFSLLKKDFPYLKLTVAGAEHTRFPNYARELKARFHAMQGLNWIGQVDEDNVKDLIRSAQIVALPYTASTGSSSVLFQAATWGRAIVASNLSETKALANENNLQVEFFESGNHASLASSIRSLLNSPAKRREQSWHNFNAMQRARPSETIQHYFEAFNRALEKHRSKKRIPIPESV